MWHHVGAVKVSTSCDQMDSNLGDWFIHGGMVRIMYTRVAVVDDNEWLRTLMLR